MADRPTINITNLTDEQKLKATEGLAYVEQWHNDSLRVRFVYKDGQCSDWFSRVWYGLSWREIKPIGQHTPLKNFIVTYI